MKARIYSIHTSSLFFNLPNYPQGEGVCFRLKTRKAIYRVYPLIFCQKSNIQLKFSGTMPLPCQLINNTTFVHKSKIHHWIEQIINYHNKIIRSWFPIHCPTMSINFSQMHLGLLLKTQTQIFSSFGSATEVILCKSISKWTHIIKRRYNSIRLTNMRNALIEN